MKRFLAIYIGTEAALERSGWDELSEEEREARRASGFGGAHSGAIVDQGSPLGKTKHASAQEI